MYIILLHLFHVVQAGSLLFQQFPFLHTLTQSANMVNLIAKLIFFHHYDSNLNTQINKRLFNPTKLIQIDFSKRYMIAGNHFYPEFINN